MQARKQMVHVCKHAHSHSSHFLSLNVQARLSAVRGLNPSAMDFDWTPCQDQTGLWITCFEVCVCGGGEAQKVGDKIVMKGILKASVSL
jgi:hypothetical protein